MRVGLAVAGAVVVTVAVLLAALDPEVHLRGPGGGAGVPVLGDLRYDYPAITAPVATGTMLQIQSFLLTRTPLGPFVRRFLLNQNHVHYLRELVGQAHGTLSPLYFPIHRLGRAEYAEHVAARPTASQVLLDGLTGEDASASRAMAFHRAYKGNGTTPAEVAERLIRAVAQLQPRYRVFSSFLPADVRAQAKASTARWQRGQPLSVLDGVPVAFKDMVVVKGHVSTYGSAAFVDSPPSEVDDTMVTAFRMLGAIIIGLTTMTEGGVTPLGYGVKDQGPFNPYHLGHYSGGSSSGSAVAVALGLCPIAAGWDGGGSIRVPSSFSGVVGLATSMGRVAFDRAHDNTNIKGGPIAATVQDAALGLAAMAHIPSDHFYSQLYDGGVQGPPPAHLAGLTDPVAGSRVGVFWDHFNDADPTVLAACRRALDALQARGVEVVQIAIPNLAWLRLAHAIKISSEFASGWDLKYSTLADLEPNTRITVALGQTLTALEVLSAEKLRRFGFDFVHELFANHSLAAIVSPTLAMSAPVLAPEAQAHGESNTPLVISMMRYIFMANFLGLPGLTVNVGYDQGNDGMPIGLQIMGNHWQEAKLLQLGRAVHRDAAIAKLQARAPDYVDLLQTS